MISELTQDLINKIKSVPALENKVGAAVGGTEADPTMANAPLPYSWVIFGGSTPTGDSLQDGGQQYWLTQYQFTIVTGIAYGSTEADLLNNQLPVLEAIEKAVAGTKAFKYAGLWEFQGADLAKIDTDRMIYQIKFSVDGFNQAA
jgi:hypothetical protein